MRQEIKAAIVSEDPVSGAVLSRLLKEWSRADVSCQTFESVTSAVTSPWTAGADVVFVSDIPEDEDLCAAVKALRACASASVCFVVTAKRGQSALAAALRAGARDYINRYVVDEDDVHRCLWGVLRAQVHAMRRTGGESLPQPALS